MITDGLWWHLAASVLSPDVARVGSQLTGVFNMFLGSMLTSHQASGLCLTLGFSGFL